MRDEVRKILEMLSAGTINAEQAESLMEAMGFFDMTLPAISEKRAASFLLINVDSCGGDKVRLKVPAQMLKAGVGLAQSVNVSGESALNDVDIDAVMRAATEMLETGGTGEIINVKSASGDRVVIKME